MMRRFRSKDTRPEMQVRRLLHGLGYRFRVHGAALPGNPDIVFPSRRKVIFVNGCFWHAHECQLSRRPKQNGAYWIPKLEGNKARDRRNVRALRSRRWGVLTVWECQLRSPALSARLKRFLG